MNNKKNIIIICAVVVLGLLTWLVSSRLSQRSTVRQDFHVEAAAIPGMVNRIYMADKEKMMSRSATTSNALKCRKSKGTRKWVKVTDKADLERRSEKSRAI